MYVGQVVYVCRAGGVGGGGGGGGGGGETRYSGGTLRGREVTGYRRWGWKCKEGRVILIWRKSHYGTSKQPLVTDSKRSTIYRLSQTSKKRKCFLLKPYLNWGQSCPKCAIRVVGKLHFLGLHL